MNRKWNRIKLLLLILSIFSCVNISLSSQAASYKRSGCRSVSKLSYRQLASLYDATSFSNGSLYLLRPITGKNHIYRPATLTQRGYQHGLAMINYYRLAAGVRPVTFTKTGNKLASYGALILARNRYTTHHPGRPYNMSYDIYRKCYEATSTSNLCGNMYYGERSVIRTAISGQIDDISTSNVKTLGHRRWLLDPRLKTAGIGVANTSDGSYYVDVKVLGQGTSRSNKRNDYNFISWPASGNNLSDTFIGSHAWSVSLNPKKYAKPSRKSVKVTLTRLKDGKTWTFSKKTKNNMRNSLFYVNTRGYGVNNCIIFRPPKYDVNYDKDGTYIVKINGLKTKKGKKTSISYKVNFKRRRDIK